MRFLFLYWILRAESSNIVAPTAVFKKIEKEKPTMCTWE